MRKKAVQQGRSERRGESYSAPYVEPLSDARMPLVVFFRILLEPVVQQEKWRPIDRVLEIRILHHFQLGLSKGLCF